MPGVLADTRKPEHLAQLAELGIRPFELVVVNLYPFVATVASGADPDECVEQIDIGGPSMVRAAAKNHPSVAVVTDPAAYDRVLEAVRGGGFTLAQRKRLAARRSSTRPTTTCGRVLDGQCLRRHLGRAAASRRGSGRPGTKAQVLRYGENPHQRAALYLTGGAGLASAEQLHGKEMSYNNYVDADAAVRAAYDHGDRPTCRDHQARQPVRHRGRRVEGRAGAPMRAHACDPVSAFGGIIAVQPAGDGRDGAPRQGHLHRGRRGAGFRRRRAGGVAAKKNIRLVQPAGGLCRGA
jgi:phosphoribosylaminoimidazolecarboxamide formyltransferase/IMP cyclohydrolase